MIEQGLTVGLETIEVTMAVDSASRIGAYELKSDGEVIDAGKFIETWQQGSDGEWRISNDIWNSDRAAAPAEPAGGGMEHPHVMILHEVEDGEHWLNAWRGDDSRHDLFEANGAKHVHTFQHPDNPNLTGLVIAVGDMDALQAMLESDEGQAAATEDGVDLDNMNVLMETR